MAFATSDRPPAELRAFERSLPMALMRARESVMRYFRPALAEHDLSEQQWRVLRALTSADEPLSVGDLAARANLLGPSLSRMLTTLEARGLITRSPGAADGRRADITASTAGSSLVATIAPISETQYRAIASALGPDDLEMLYDLLERVADLDSGALPP
jgi:homoprotocatechuate degradation regulator HpaR